MLGRMLMLPGMALHSLRDLACGPAQQKGQFPHRFFLLSFKRLVSGARGESEVIKRCICGQEKDY